MGSGSAASHLLFMENAVALEEYLRSMLSSELLYRRRTLGLLRLIEVFLQSLTTLSGTLSTRRATLEVTLPENVIGPRRGEPRSLDPDIVRRPGDDIEDDAAAELGAGSECPGPVRNPDPDVAEARTPRVIPGSGAATLIFRGQNTA